MSSESIEETDVNTVRSLILENKDLACEIRAKSEMLYCPESGEDRVSEAKVVSGRVGREFMELLTELRTTLRYAHDALRGFNG